MGKVVPLNKIPGIVKQCQNGGGSTVGLITGCFDVLHIGHTRLFKWAKKRVDVVIVRLDSDGSIRLSKGAGRPVFKQTIRMEAVAELSSVDYVFGITRTLDFVSQTAEKYYTSLAKRISPDFLITHSQKDKFVRTKSHRAREMGIEALVYRGTGAISSTKIVEKIKRLG